MQWSVGITMVAGLGLLLPEAAAQRKDDRVLARYKRMYRPASVVKIEGKRTYIQLDQGGRVRWYTRGSSNVRAFDWHTGLSVRCWIARKWRPGTIKSIRGRSLRVAFPALGVKPITTVDCIDRRDKSQIPVLGTVVHSGSARSPSATPRITRSRPSPPRSSRTRPATRTTRTQPAAARPLAVKNVFAAVLSRLKRHPFVRNGFIDSQLSGEYVRLTTEGRLVKHHVVKFFASGSGFLTINTWGLSRTNRLVTDPRRTVRVVFTWSVHKRKFGTMEAPMVRLKFKDGTTMAFFYGKRGTTIGARLADERRRTVGDAVLFRGSAEFFADWNRSLESVRLSLVKAERARAARVSARRLQNLNMSMGNNNLLMLKTMNFGSTGSFSF